MLVYLWAYYSPELAMEHWFDDATRSHLAVKILLNINYTSDNCNLVCI